MRLTILVGILVIAAVLALSRFREDILEIFSGPSAPLIVDALVKPRQLPALMPPRPPEDYIVAAPQSEVAVTVDPVPATPVALVDARSLARHAVEAANARRNADSLTDKIDANNTQFAELGESISNLNLTIRSECRNVDYLDSRIRRIQNSLHDGVFMRGWRAPIIHDNENRALRQAQSDYDNATSRLSAARSALASCTQTRADLTASTQKLRRAIELLRR